MLDRVLKIAQTVSLALIAIAFVVIAYSEWRQIELSKHKIAASLVPSDGRFLLVDYNYLKSYKEYNTPTKEILTYIYEENSR